MNPEVRKRLAGAAAANGRSLSQTAERLIEDGLDGKARIDELLGGLEVAGTLQRLASAARSIKDLGCPLTSDSGHRLLMQVWEKIITSGPPPYPEPVQHERAVARLRHGAAQEALAAAPKNEELGARAEMTKKALDEAEAAEAEFERALAEKAQALLELMGLDRA